VALDLAILDELRDRALEDLVALDVDEAAVLGDPLDHRRRRDHERDAQARRDHLRHRPEVDHHAVAILVASGRIGGPSYWNAWS
jgi:hypothetical protein